MGVPWADSVARCVVQCTEFHCESGGLGLGLWGFFPIIYCSAVLRLLARQALLPFPRAVDEALLWVHAHPAGCVWWLLGTGGCGAFCSLFATRNDWLRPRGMVTETHWIFRLQSQQCFPTSRWGVFIEQLPVPLCYCGWAASLAVINLANRDNGILHVLSHLYVSSHKATPLPERINRIKKVGASFGTCTETWAGFAIHSWNCWAVDIHIFVISDWFSSSCMLYKLV